MHFLKLNHLQMDHFKNYWFVWWDLTLKAPVVSWCKDGWGGKWVGCSSLAAHPSATPPIKKAYNLSHPLSDAFNPEYQMST
jgi:hypothetical protein